MPLQHAGLDLSQLAGLVGHGGAFAGDVFQGTLEPLSPWVSFKPEPYIFVGGRF